MHQTDVIIIGSGIAALSAAYHLKHKHVTIITKSSWNDSNSMLAQGGIAAAVDHTDSWIAHYQDTIIAGCDHNDIRNVEHLVKDGPREIAEWCKRGMSFDCDINGEFLLGKEGAHSRNRIIHAGGDATGREMTLFLYQAAKKYVTIVEHETALDLIVKDGVCLGVITRDRVGEISHYYADSTIIASGGCGAVYGHTSNANVITGDGIAMAFRAGAAIADMEFIQFHPTMLRIEDMCVGLVSEAVRGEGGRLVNHLGAYFMDGTHPQGDLAPRDVVSRKIFSELKRGNKVYLDISNIKDFSKRFPTITKMCNQYEVNLAEQKIPVAPGMHFLMGGIQTNNKGQTSIKNLYAVGEAACTGVHGANRLASNSLLEGLVFGKRVANYLLSLKIERSHYLELVEKTNYLSGAKSDKKLPSKKQIQDIMTNCVGIQRTESELMYAVRWFESYNGSHSFWDINVKDFTNDEIEIINMLTTGWLITTSALKRTESRGGHFRLDYPERNDKEWLKKQLVRTKGEILMGV